MRRLLGGLALVTLITAAASLATVNRARATELAAHQEVIQISAAVPGPVIRLAPVVVSQVEQAYAIERRATAIDVLVCLVAERASSDSTAVSDSILQRLHVVIPRRYESSVAPSSSRSPAILHRSAANRSEPDSTTLLRTTRSERS
jgi:hypothetical protein